MIAFSGALASFAPSRLATGPLAGWLDEALKGRAPDGQRHRVNLRLEVLYARRRAHRKLLEPVPDLKRETTWLLGALETEREALGLGFQQWQSIDAAIKRSASAWHGEEQAESE